MMQVFGKKAQFEKFGDYTLLKKIASGGMAEILLAVDRDPTGGNAGRFVVIKRALTQYSNNEEFASMFKNEGQLACNLKHSNIVSVYEFGVDSHQLYLCLEHISGKNLREMTKKLNSTKKPIPIEHSIHIVKEVASGLDYAHNAVDSHSGKPFNLIHRDVSPQNIMLSYDGDVKLIDFGIAKLADSNLTQAGHLKGKFGYMSPEQAQGDNLDNQTDIFSLGIILWELLANERLFAHKNEMTSLKKIKACNIPDIQKINPKVSLNLANIVNKALAKNKNSRYKTASELEKDLNIFLNMNYPEFVRRDFVNFVKGMYAKEILNEREMLKTYSNKLKKHMESSNLNSLAEDGKPSKLSIQSAEKPRKVSKSRGTETDVENVLSDKNLTETEFSGDDAYYYATGSWKPPTNSSSNLPVNSSDPIIKDNYEQLQHADSISMKHPQFTQSKSHTGTQELGKSLKSLFGVGVFLAVCISTFFLVKNLEHISLSKPVSDFLDHFYTKDASQALTKKDGKPESKARKTTRQPSQNLKRIYITTHPSGTEIYINDKFYGHSPEVVPFPNQNNITLTLKKQGYHSKSFQSTTGAAKLPKKIEIQLKPIDE